MPSDSYPLQDGSQGRGSIPFSTGSESVGTSESVVRTLTALVRRFSRFLGVGSVGFVVDSSTFMALSAAGLSPAVARALSMILGTFVVWQLNRRFTFVRSGRRHAVEGGLYAAVALVAQGLSYTVFLVLIYAVPEIPRAVSFVFGCGLGAVVGFTGHHLLTFAPALRPASVAVSQD